METLFFQLKKNSANVGFIKTPYGL